MEFSTLTICIYGNITSATTIFVLPNLYKVTVQKTCYDKILKLLVFLELVIILITGFKPTYDSSIATLY